MTAPTVDPLTLLSLIRLAVPDGDYVRESDLRTLMVEVDRHIAEYIAAMFRRQHQPEVQDKPEDLFGIFSDPAEVTA